MPEELSVAMREEILALMAAHRITAYAIWKATGMPQTTLSRKLRAPDGKFDLDDVQQIAPVFGVEPEDLVGWARRRTKPHPSE